MQLVLEDQLSFSVSTVTGQSSFVYGSQWYPRDFCASWNHNLDVRNVHVGTGSTISVLPVIQFAAVRPERPDDAVLASSEAALTSPGLEHYNESPASIAQKGWWRPGVVYWLSGVGSTPFGRAEGTLYTSWRPQGWTMPAEQVVFNPTNDNTLWSVFPLARGRAIPTRGVDKLGAIVVGQGNANADVEYWLYLRVFDDLRARGDWTIAGTGTGGAATATPGAGNFEVNHGEIATPAGITLGNFQWCELALGARHVNNGAPSRLTFDIIPSIKYS